MNLKGKSSKAFILFNSFLISTLSLFLVVGCGGESTETDNKSQNLEETNPSGLTDWEMESGFGPIKKKLNLGEINEQLAKEGQEIFDTKCITCHKLDERYTGPAQRDVLQRITPEYFMNMVINPDENVEKHPRAKRMLAEYMNKMTNQNITIKDARALLEYFRVLDKELKEKQQVNK